MPRLNELFILDAPNLDIHLQTKSFHVLRLSNVDLSVHHSVLGGVLFSLLAGD